MLSFSAAAAPLLFFWASLARLLDQRRAAGRLLSIITEDNSNLLDVCIDIKDTIQRCIFADPR